MDATYLFRETPVFNCAIGDNITKKTYDLCQKFINYHTQIQTENISRSVDEDTTLDQIIEEFKKRDDLVIHDGSILHVFSKNNKFILHLRIMRSCLNKKTINMKIAFNDVRVKEEILAFVENELFAEKNPFVNIDWCFLKKDGNFEEIEIPQIIDEELYSESYPPIIKDLEYKSVNHFIDSYFKSNSSILLLLGPPGTGKTKLIRYILKQMALNSKEQNTITAKYAVNEDAIEDDQLFINFMRDLSSALLMEDMKVSLSKKENHSTTIHRILAASDGIINMSNKKIIISTNLQQEEIDEALTRPGRCFMSLDLRALSGTEANQVLNRLDEGKELERFPESENSTYYLSEVYDYVNNGSLNKNSIPLSRKTSKRVGF